MAEIPYLQSSSRVPTWCMVLSYCILQATRMGASDASSSGELSGLGFWSMPSSSPVICVIDSPEKFDAIIQSLNSAAVVGLDCEWRPVARKKGSAASRASPRVAILQIACRGRLSLADGEREALYVLDMLALKPSTFAAPLKAMFSSPHILKLGYAFKDDLRHLAASFPGPESRGCFDSVNNFIDVGKLFQTVRGGSESSFSRTGGLSAIANAVLGLPLSKELQCSDWEARPLSAGQLLYAATDAYCLLPIYDKLLQASLPSGTSGKGLSIMLSSPWKPSPPLSIASALDLAPPTVTTDITRSQQPFQAPATCLLSSCSISPEDAATAANLASSGMEGMMDDVAVVTGRFSERLSLNSINHEAGRRKPKKKQGSKLRRPPDSVDRANGGELSDDCDWSGPPPWEEKDGDCIEPKFLCDVHVEGLARQLRCVGFDTASALGPRADARQMVEQAEKEGRVLLTRDRRLIRRRLLPPNRAYLVKALGKQAQLKEVLSTFQLGVRARRLLCRCIRCNGDFVPTALGPQEAAAAAPWSQVIPECALRAHSEFWQCADCRHIYWEGTQFQRAILQFEAAFEGIMEGTVAEDRYPRSDMVPAIVQVPDEGMANSRTVGYCTEPGEERLGSDEISGPLGPLNEKRKVKESKPTTSEGTESRMLGVRESGVHKQPCKSCAERRKKKAERKQLVLSADQL